jgi:hypothetical protein
MGCTRSNKWLPIDPTRVALPPQTYIGEIASKGREGMAAAFVVCAASLGILLGSLVVLTVLAACSPDQLLVWGWRIPFLLAVVSGSLVSARQGLIAATANLGRAMRLDAPSTLASA